MGAPKKVKQLKLFNGGANCLKRSGDPRWTGLSYNETPSAFIAAHSRADAIRMIIAYRGFEGCGLASYIKDYWSEGRWGRIMDGITPERGIWIQFKRNEPPVKVYDGDKDERL